MNSEGDYLERVRDKYDLPIKLGCKRCLRPLYKDSYNREYCAQCITNTLPHILSRELQSLFRLMQRLPDEWGVNYELPQHFDGTLVATGEGVELIIEGLEPGTCPQVIEYLDSSLRLYIPDAVIGVQSLKHPENLLEHKRAYRRFEPSRFAGLSPHGTSYYAGELFGQQNGPRPRCFYCNGELKGGIKGTPFDLYIPICQGLPYNTFYYVHLCPPCAETGEHNFIRELRRAENPHSLQRIREERYQLQRYDKIAAEAKTPVGWNWR